MRRPLQLREHRNIIEAEGSSDVVAPRKKSTTQWVDSVTLLSPPRGLVLGLTNLPLRCRELVLAEDPDYGGVTQHHVQSLARLHRTDLRIVGDPEHIQPRWSLFFALCTRPRS